MRPDTPVSSRCSQSHHRHTGQGTNRNAGNAQLSVHPLNNNCRLCLAGHGYKSSNDNSPRDPSPCLRGHMQDPMTSTAAACLCVRPVWHRRRSQEPSRDNTVSTGRHNKHHHSTDAACYHSTISYTVFIQRALPGRLDG
ncbi:hypothetical protein O3P69_003307 [Scylla paramamosain]|uniref:Uncharacterized protein n=1 Tax=Scylla paramamosain TaxID=85552 RepID=A0AAW0UL00_SCYPA